MCLKGNNEERRSHQFERKQREFYGEGWRKEWENDVIILSQK